MIRRILGVIICLPILMLYSCKPGDVCGPGKILDCTGNCLKSAVLYGSLDDGVCNENLNCSEFYYDAGDCEDRSCVPNGASCPDPMEMDDVWCCSGCCCLGPSPEPWYICWDPETCLGGCW